MDKMLIVIPIALYLVINLAVGIWASKEQAAANKSGFINQYFIGGRSMGGLVLAMTLIATFTSASSFIGGPGVASAKGLSWVFLSMIQVPTAFLILGVLGKKFAVISRKINAVTVTDYLRARYESPAVVILSSIALVLFFIAMMIGQFIGGAVLFQTVTGYSYIVGLTLFALIVVIYTTIGGFKAVVITDTIQGLVMVFGTILILYSIIHAGGGVDTIVVKLNEINPEWSSPTGNGSAKVYVLSFWILVGLGVLGLPQTAVRGMGFKNTKSLHNAMIYGTIVIGFLMLGMHISGVFAKVLIPADLASTDLVIPTVVMQVMHPVVAGLFLAAPLAAVMSTVSSLLILASAAIIKDIYLNYIIKNHTEAEDAKFNAKIGKMSTWGTAVIGLIVFAMAVVPPDLIVWINLFAFGGLEAAFLCPIIFGMYWKRANATGAILSFICGVGFFLYCGYFKLSFFGMHNIVPTIAIAIIAFIVGSLIGKKTSDETLELFFSEKN
ncbi:sodium/pantothenate symporter [Sinanaerobacter chloroacetimidivorans]|jgi:sodium/pantothenate symporter|uniref:Sodium/pantothenate symporter n=1 Tax=Sinanaerobacter chloroacetimidivorans TaxID=2818044 RepID=A0A8J7W1D6_9FIRM|nr:sodium/pantothenate symporter [Sinanaerobacter chloroacetimidivorans]MBR0598641.1 sodium/pantothenate symporter [Sinanaerobacter chloroacetimidivorans]